MSGPASRDEADALLRELTSEIRARLRDEVVGIYVFGSFAAGDFEPAWSDLDLLIALRRDVKPADLDALESMHRSIEERHPSWAGRIDACYLALASLARPDRESPIVVISPGEPLHRTRTSPGWRMNWHSVREHGISLFGPDPSELIAATSTSEFLAAVWVHLLEMPRRTRASSEPRFHAYAVLTGCRAAFAFEERRQSSKPEAAQWASKRLPEWAPLIEEAVAARRGEGARTRDMRDDAAAFLDFLVATLDADRPT